MLLSCGINRSSFTPSKKYSPQQLQRDYAVYRGALEKHHPGLYWYTSKDSLDHYFEKGRSMLNDSLTEPAFRKVLSYVTSRINCGHTSVRTSKSWNRQRDTALLNRMFPLSVKVWPDTMVMIANLNRRDSTLQRGHVITSINGRGVQQIVDTMFDFISTDGYNLTHKYQSLSNRGYFGALYTLLFGISTKYTIEYLDHDGQKKTAVIPVYDPSKDTLDRRALRPVNRLPQPSAKERKQQQLENVRQLKIDTAGRTAIMELASFGRNYGLRRFFRHSFRALRKNDITHLIIDVRGNGGGSVTNSTIITRYLINKKFKICDSLYAVRKKSPYQSHIQHHFWNKLFMTFFTRKKNNGYYHFGYFERHRFKPKKANHYHGWVYILTGGNSFSATTLFSSALKEQENITLVGEETGGGAYGNSAWLIPDLTLPETRVRVRLPLFRLVIDKNIPKTGRGVQPEVDALPAVEAIRNNRDFKMDKALELIQKDKERTATN